MTGKLINVAIFWLPLIGALILGTLVPFLWSGEQKIPALWVGFFGIVCLLLTGAFQVQDFIERRLLQPQLEIDSPVQRSLLKFDPRQDNSMNVRGENDVLPSDGWKVPTLTVKNTSPVYAQDVTLNWVAAPYDIKALVASNPDLVRSQFTTDGQSLKITSQNSIPFVHPFSFKSVMPLTFITKSAGIFVPLDIWNTAALYFIATLPSQVGARSEPYFFDLKISWNIPDSAKVAHFRVKAVATNVQPLIPEKQGFLASVELTTEKLD
jgi:hypothetical protein